MSYRNRKIKVQILLKDGETFDGTHDQITIENARCHVTYKEVTGLSGTNLTLTIWGLPEQYVARIGGMGIIAVASKGFRLKVWAEGEPIFEGVITTAYADFTRMPEPPFIITASPSVWMQSQMFGGVSLRGTHTAASLVQSICEGIGVGFENYGVDAMITNPYFQGNAFNCIYQITSAVRAIVECSMSKVEMWKDTTTRGDRVLAVSKENGLLNYPTWCNVGLLIHVLFTREAITGRMLDLKTDLPNATGRYSIIGVENNISANLPNGLWQSSLRIIPLNKQ